MTHPNRPDTASQPTPPSPFGAAFRAETAATARTQDGRVVGVGCSVWPTGQRPAGAQRAGRYLPETLEHPARMWPDVAAYAISHLTEPGQLVFDPMCGAGTTLVEALHLRRPAVGIDVEPRWASLARANTDNTRRQLGGHGYVITADSRILPDALPPQYRDQMLGRVSLLLTSPPYGSRTHGMVRTGTRGVSKTHYRYSTTPRRANNLAHQPITELLDGLTTILTGSRPLLAPHAHVVITTRPWREHGELIDLPGAVTAAARAAGLIPVQRCAALLAGLSTTTDPADTDDYSDSDDHAERSEQKRRDEARRLVTRASFFQRANVASGRAHGQPWALICHEDVLIFRQPRTSDSTRPGRRPADTDTTARPLRTRARGRHRGIAPGLRRDVLAAA